MGRENNTAAGWLPFVSKKAYASVVLDLECERVHAEKEAKYSQGVIDGLKKIVKMMRDENQSLQKANRELVQGQDRLQLELLESRQENRKLQLQINSLEARWGKDACI